MQNITVRNMYVYAGKIIDVLLYQHKYRSDAEEKRKTHTDDVVEEEAASK